MSTNGEFEDALAEYEGVIEQIAEIVRRMKKTKDGERRFELNTELNALYKTGFSLKNKMDETIDK